MGSITVPVETGKSGIPLTATKQAPELFGWSHTNDRGYSIREEPMGSLKPMRIVVLGAGAGGINFCKTARDKLQNVEVVCYEKSPEVGGTWFENKYPGVACDIPSVSYQFTWEPHIWPEYYSSGHEIWKYLRGIVDKYELMQYIKLQHIIKSAEWIEAKWHISIERPDGSTFVDVCDMFVNGGGVLNNWRYPDIEGLHTFKGKLMHSATWDTTFDLKNKEIAVLGTGSSAAQIVPSLQPIVKKLYSFNRSPTWITAGFAQKFAGPNGGNFAYTEKQKKRLAEDPNFYLEYRKMIESEISERFRFILRNSPEAVMAREYSISEMKRRLNGDGRLTNAIIPKNFSIGCRRPTPGEGFLEALVAPNVSVYTDTLKCVTETGFIGPDNVEHKVDAIICATGFDTSWIPKFPLIGNGKDLRDVWKSHALSYLAVGVPEFPNYLTLGGPYGPLAVGSFLPVLEQFTNYICQVVTKMQIEKITSMAPRLKAAKQFQEHHDLYVQRTAWTELCSSWFKQGKPERNSLLTMYPGSRVHFFDLLKTPRYEDFDIEYESDNQWNFLGNGFSVREFDGRDTTDYCGLLNGVDKQPEFNIDL